MHDIQLYVPAYVGHVLYGKDLVCISSCVCVCVCGHSSVRVIGLVERTVINRASMLADLLTLDLSAST